MDIGSVPGEIGILPEYREGYRNPPGTIWAFMGLSGKVKGAAMVGCAPPPPLVLLGLGEVAGHLSLSLSPLGVLFGIGFHEGGKRERGTATSPSPNRTRGRGGAQPN